MNQNIIFKVNSHGENMTKMDLVQIISDLWAEYDPPFERFQWPIESLRWNALVFSIISRSNPQVNTDSLLRALLALDLIKVEKLAQLDGEPSQWATSSRAQLITRVFEEAGYGKEAAETALITLIEAAKTIQTTFEGKIQKLLRQESQLLIQNVMKHFNFSNLEEESVKDIMINWLQNILNLPIYLETESSKSFCVEYDATVQELISVADDLDINLALLDELLQRWYNGKQAMSNIAGGENINNNQQEG